MQPWREGTITSKTDRDPREDKGWDAQYHPYSFYFFSWGGGGGVKIPYPLLGYWAT